jgi:hypothetical protein
MTGICDGFDVGDGAWFRGWFWGDVGGVSCVPVFHEDLGHCAAAAGLVEGFFGGGAFVLGLGG